MTRFSDIFLEKRCQRIQKDSSKSLESSTKNPKSKSPKSKSDQASKESPLMRQTVNYIHSFEIKIPRIEIEAQYATSLEKLAKKAFPPKPVQRIHLQDELPEDVKHPSIEFNLK